jgi:hypothetical protein
MKSPKNPSMKTDQDPAFPVHKIERKILLCKVNFFPPKFPFPKYKRKFWREKVYFAKERGL